VRGSIATTGVQAAADRVIASNTHTRYRRADSPSVARAVDRNMVAQSIVSLQRSRTMPSPMRYPIGVLGYLRLAFDVDLIGFTSCKVRRNTPDVRFGRMEGVTHDPQLA
jgi:hypothetical protein